MRLLSSVFVIAAILSTNCISSAQEKIQKVARSSSMSSPISLVKIDKDDTIKVSIVTSIPIIASITKDSTNLSKNDTLKVVVMNAEPKLKKWQYSYNYIDARFNDTPDLGDLNGKGADGWELVGVTFYKSNCLVVFKKPL